MLLLKNNYKKVLVCLIANVAKLKAETFTGLKYYGTLGLHRSVKYYNFLVLDFGFQLFVYNTKLRVSN